MDLIRISEAKEEEEKEEVRNEEIQFIDEIAFRYNQ